MSAHNSNIAMRTLTFIGLSLREEVLIKSMLKLMTSRVNHEWRVLDCGEVNADKIFINPANRLARHLFEASTSKEHYVLVTDLSGLVFTGAMVLHTPFRTHDLEIILNGSSAKHHTDIGRGTDSRNIAANMSSRRDAVDNLAQAIYKLERNAKPGDALLKCGRLEAIISVENAMATFISPSGFQPQDPKAWAEIADSITDGEYTLTEYKSDNCLNENAEMHALDDVLWNMGLNVFSKELILGLDPMSGFHLTLYPPIVPGEQAAIMLKMSSLLTRQSLSLRQLVKFTGSDEHVCVAFINACFLCNILDWKAQFKGSTPAADLLIESAKTTKFSRIAGLIRSAFGRIKTA